MDAHMYGWMDVWMCGCVGVCMCVCVHVCMCGYVAMWMCGCVDVCNCFQLRHCRNVFVITPVAWLATARGMVCSVAEPESTASLRKSLCRVPCTSEFL